MLRSYAAVVEVENTGALAKNEISRAYEAWLRRYNSPNMRTWWAANRNLITFENLRKRIESEIFPETPAWSEADGNDAFTERRFGA